MTDPTYGRPQRQARPIMPSQFHSCFSAFVEDLQYPGGATTASPSFVSGNPSGPPGPLAGLAGGNFFPLTGTKRQKKLGT